MREFVTSKKLREIAAQRRWIAEHGGSRSGYRYHYAAVYERVQIDRIYDADTERLARLLKGVQ